MQIEAKPESLIGGISKKSKNRFVPQSELVAGVEGVTGFAKVLNDAFAGGLASIPLSWSEKLSPTSMYSGVVDGGQLDLKFQ